MNPVTSSLIRSVATSQLGTNWVFSPASYLGALYRLAQCAGGDNRAEIARALGTTPGGLPIEATRFERATEGLDTYDCVLSRATYRDYLVPEVLETLHALGGDLLTYATSDEAVALVNALAAEKTHGKITNLLSRDHVNELTQLIVLNCVYFKREWYTTFDRPTYDEPFHNADGTVAKLGLLKRQHWYRYYEGDGYDLVEIRYQESPICCYLWVPTTATLPTLIDHFDEHYTNITRVKQDLDCHLTVPPFTVANTWHKLPEMTRLAGITRAFEETQEWRVWDWVKMNGGWAKVDAIIQKAYFDFTREGTEAAAATAMTMMACSGYIPMREPPRIKTIRADKPFLFALANPAYPQTPLFVGAVNQL